MKKYKAIIYDIDGTLLDTLKMNMYPLMKIIKEETGEDWTFEQVLKFAAYPGMKVMEELGVKDQEKTYARWVQYVNDYEDGATLFEGFEEVLETFKKSNKQLSLLNLENNMKLILFLKELINTWKLLFYKMILLFINLIRNHY